ncbi:L,D-transpeptidase scaffold domain-containing protein [Phenylobacterium soli]|uniref:L,D-transpeptidase n=1 Tax=Phenylobacterium soli TaxID=2170551 RepID=A0A328AGS4_9CAUL|nr:L,D-transpeptidase family protein [Phenylobacterium soli]RAK53316.1 L,D-transpeptidase [Phenylobacterium soli]
MPLSARVAPLPGGAAQAERLGPVGGALRAQLAQAEPELQAFYRARGWRPLWIRGWGLRDDAQAVVQAVSGAAADGLDPDRYGAPGLGEVLAQASSQQPSDLARAEIALSRAAAGYLSDLHAPAPGATMIYADPALAPPTPDRLGVLKALATWPHPADGVARLSRMNPIYRQLRDALAAWKAKEAGEEAAAAERLIRTNLERARLLPPDLGQRYILVDAAAQTLWLYQDGQAVDSMKVVVGKPSEPTPMMAGLVRYAVARPYWNVPPDLVANSIAPKVLRLGPAWLEAQDMEILSDWTPNARLLTPQEVDWRAVAGGRTVLRVRQRPGPHNMMGQVKFIFPNSVGVYLHDSPLRQYFAQSRRTESAGCVRLSDAPRLARWLLSERAGELSQPGAPETRIDLAAPVPVYIVYFTALPNGDDLDRRPDIYRRDPPLEARLARRA